MKSVAYEELLERDGKVITHVVGYSMLPLLHDRESIVIVETVEKVPPKKGDVVLYKTGGTYILHRVMRILPDKYLIRGDNTWMMEHVPKNALLATMTGFYRKAEGKLITRDNLGYRMYRMVLPGIRWGRRIGNKVKRTAWRILEREKKEATRN